MMIVGFLRIAGWEVWENDDDDIDEINNYYIFCSSLTLFLGINYWEAYIY